VERPKPYPEVSEDQSYLSLLAGRLGELLGSRLAGIYVGGSYALGDYQRGRSDLDVAAVVESGIPLDLKQRIVAATRHESLPCPARGLELVIYRLETARSGSAAGEFELNLNTGERMAPRVDLVPGGESHWFSIDRSILAQAGMALYGPPAGEVFAPIGLEALRPVLAESIAWHRRNPGPRGDGVLNASRALRFVSEGRWSSKTEAGRWAIERGAFPRETVLAALEARGA